MIKTILSIITGIGTFILIKTLLGAGFGIWLISFFSGVAVFILVRRLLKILANKLEKGKKENKKGNGVSGTPSQRNKKMIDDGIRRVVGIRNKTRLIKSNEVARNIQDICKVGIEIFNHVKNSPEEIKKIRQFNNYYLDTTEKIVSQYIDLSNKREGAAEIEESLKKVELLLDPIKKTFDKQLANLLENDLLDLDVEISVLEKTMKMEG
ncbi:5-bromo-4-chloroindolyl phosphate hydrolysis family protein [Spirochaetota bacterium]